HAPRCPVRCLRRAGVPAGTGADARGTVPGAGVPPRARQHLRCAEQRRGGDRPAEAGSGRGPAPAVGRRPDPAGLRREQLAAAGTGRACAVSTWRRRAGETGRGGFSCHTYAGGGGTARLTRGGPYSSAAALDPGRTSWPLPRDAARLGPADDATAVTAAQLRD